METDANLHSESMSVARELYESTTEIEHLSLAGAMTHPPPVVDVTSASRYGNSSAVSFRTMGIGEAA